MRSALILVVVCWATWALIAQAQNSVQTKGLKSQGNNNNRIAVEDSRTLQAPPTSSPYVPPLWVPVWGHVCPLIEKTNGKAVFCCDGFCNDGLSIFDPKSLCYNRGNECVDGPGIKCARNQWGYVLAESAQTGDGICDLSCQWERFVFSLYCCDCPDGYIEWKHDLSCEEKRLDLVWWCVGCPDGYELTGDYHSEFKCKPKETETPTTKPTEQSTLQPSKQPTNSCSQRTLCQPCLKPPNAKPTDTGNCKTCLEAEKLTKYAEDSGGGTDVLYHPSDDSGVTLGYGYDLRERTAASIVRDLEAAGMDHSTAQKISEGAGKSGANAAAFLAQNKNIRIRLAVREKLYKNEYAKKKLEAKNYATWTKYTGNNATAVGRAVVKGLKDRLTYVLSSKQWQGLHPAMVDLLTDMKYQGGYYAYDRIAKVNAALKAKDGNQLAQFQAVAALFEKQNTKNTKTGKIVSYMDDYAINIGEGVYNKKDESFYGQSAQALVCERRRNCIRLAYLKQIIAALKLKQEIKIC